MAGAVLGAGLEHAWPNAGTTMLILELLPGAGLGAVTYALVVWLTWMSSAQPDGAERDVLQALQSSWAWARGKFAQAAIL